MDVNKLHLSIITPTATKVDEDVDMVIVRSTTGDMGFLPRREMCMVLLDYGILRIINGDTERHILVHGGVAEVKDNRILVLTGTAEWPSDIDLARAEADKVQAEHVLQGHADDLELYHANIMLRRSLVQIEISSYPLISSAPKK